MTYPSLLYLNGRTGTEINRELFEDIKLCNILSAPSIGAVNSICSEEDITARREVFSALQNGKTRRQLSKLSENVKKIAELYSLFESAREDCEKHITLVGLLDAVICFYRAAAGFEGSGTLCERFSGFFKNELNTPSVKRLEAALEKALPKIPECTKNKSRFKIRGENIRVQSASKQTYVSAISECAENLGLNAPQFAITQPVTLSKEIIRGLSSLYPDAFNEFSAFYESQKSFFSKDILKYADEASFYLEFCEMFDRVTKAGIPLTFPSVSREKRISIKSAYDITLLTKDEMKIIPNDASFTPDEPFFYLTGANGGGKTTYLRTVGVALVMFALGCPVACDNAEIYIPSGIFTHFPRDERNDTSGHFTDEQNRVDDILRTADENSVVLLNETYSTTNEETAVELTSALAERLFSAGIFGIYITHQHGISQTEIPYLNVVVDRDDRNRRTYKVEKKRTENGSFARDILEKYKLTRESLGERFGKK